MTVVIDGNVTLADVDVLIDALHSQVDQLSGSQASALVRDATRSAAKLSSLRVALVAKVNSSQIWRDRGGPNTTAASFLREEHLLDHGEAKADLVAAQGCERFPELADACRAGCVSRDKVDLILRIGLRNRQREVALPAFIPIFIELASRAPMSHLRRALDLWADQVDPVTTRTDEDDAHTRRELHVVQLGDGVKLDGFFGKAQGMRVITALNGALAKQWKDSTDGQTPARERVAASTAAQRADAFIDGIINPVLSNKLVPTCGGAPATVCVTVPIDRLQNPDGPVAEDAIAASFANGTLRLESASIRSTNGPGEAVLSAQSALQISCDCNVQRVIMSAAGRPIDIGRSTRVIPEQIRTALVIRDGTCVYPYCQVPAGWAEGHHVQHWSRGGSTSLDNLALLCSKHHHKVHAENISITFNSDGKPVVATQNQYRHAR